jgi:hypothetical protein
VHDRRRSTDAGLYAQDRLELGAGGGGYQDAAVGQVILLAYLDAYIKLVTQLGGLAANAGEVSRA